MLEQTREIVARLQSVGFARREFRVRTEFDRRRGCYLDPMIVIWDMDKAIRLSDRLVAHGFRVIHYVRDGAVRRMSVYPYCHSGDCPIEVVDFSSEVCPQCGQEVEHWKMTHHIAVFH